LSTDCPLAVQPLSIALLGKGITSPILLNYRKKKKMQVRNRYKWVLILGFITILMIALAYLVSEKMIQQLDEEGVPIGVMIFPTSLDEIKVWNEQSLDLLNQKSLKII
jgi:hypothetical protein